MKGHLGVGREKESCDVQRDFLKGAYATSSCYRGNVPHLVWQVLLPLSRALDSQQ